MPIQPIFPVCSESKEGEAAASGGVSYQANLTGSGAIAQGPGGTAVGAGGVLVGDGNAGNLNTGTQVMGDVSGTGIAIGQGAQAHVAQGISPRDLEPLFASLLAAVARNAPPNTQPAAVKKVEELKAEAAKGKDADDEQMGTIIEGLTKMVPGAVSAVVSAFASPILGGIAGPVTKYVLKKFTES